MGSGNLLSLQADLEDEAMRLLKRAEAFRVRKMAQMSRTGSREYPGTFVLSHNHGFTDVVISWTGKGCPGQHGPLSITRVMYVEAKYVVQD